LRRGRLEEEEGAVFPTSKGGDRGKGGRLKKEELVGEGANIKIRGQKL